MAKSALTREVYSCPVSRDRAPSRSSLERGRLRVVPVTLTEANAFVVRYHRHHSTKSGARFALAATVDGAIVGVAIVARPVARLLDDGKTAELARLATDGTANACSFLLATVARVARAMGYQRLITYTLPAEGGASLRAAGWRAEQLTAGGGWSRLGRPRADENPCAKLRWTAW